MIEQLPIEDAYPNARRAVAYSEKAFNVVLQIARRHGFSIETVIEGIAVSSELFCPELIPEMRTDDFRRYVAAKLGMM